MARRDGGQRKWSLLPRGWTLVPRVIGFDSIDLGLTLEDIMDDLEPNWRGRVPEAVESPGRFRAA